MCMKERERESVCVCVCERERETRPFTRKSNLKGQCLETPENVVFRFYAQRVSE